MAEQTNFYAVQRGAPWSFRPVSDGVINWYLYNFGSNLGIAFVERPSNLWVEMPWNCIFRVKNFVFSSASGGLRPPDPPLWAPYIFTSGFFFFPCAHPWIQILFCIFRFCLTFIQILCQIKVAGLDTVETISLWNTNLVYAARCHIDKVLFVCEI